MDTKDLQEKLVLYLDSIGRTIIAEEDVERSTDTHIVGSNPVIIHVEPNGGNISIQFFPTVFKEFLGSKDDKATFTILKDNISIMDKTVFDFKLYSQYAGMFAEDASVKPASSNTAVADVNSQPEVIKLFED